MSTTAKPKSNRLLELDALRGIAALGVVIFHYTCWYSNKFDLNVEPTFMFPLGYCGVHLFFMISGFVIFMTLEKTKKPSDFVWSRFTRLFPAYWAVILINLAIFHNIGLERFMHNFTMGTAWFNSKYIDESFWTLTVELSFYAVMLVLYQTKKLKYIEEIGLFWLALMMLYARLKNVLPIQIPWVLDKSLLLAHGNLFFAGIIFYKIKTDRATPQRFIALGLCLLTQFLVAREYFPTPVMMAVFYLVFYLFCTNRLKILQNPVLLYFGSISYSLYLIHENLGTKMMLYFDAMKMNYYLNLGLAIAASIAVASLVSFLIEKPALKYLRKKPAQPAVSATP